MKNTLYILLVVSFASCTKPEGNWCDCELLGNNDYWNCEQLLDTVGLNLYSFVPFTDEWGPGKTPYAELLESRQIPEDFMAKMTTKELFYQYVYCGLSKSGLFMFNYVQLEERLNMVTELLIRRNTGHTLLEILQRIDPAGIEWSWSRDCRYTYVYLLIFMAQPEVIMYMTDEEICKYILIQKRSQEIILSLCESDPYYWGYMPELNLINTGLGNVKVLHKKFEPFVQLIEENEGCWSVKD